MRETMRNRRRSWREMAEWYNAKQGEEGDLWHRSLIDPTLLQVLGDLKEKHVLDLGCGNGYPSRKLARSGAKVTGVDSSEPIIERARRRESKSPSGASFHVAEAADLRTIADATFDLVFSNMALMDIADGAGAIRKAARVLKTRGRFVASLSHPCFDTGNSSGWLLERIGLNTTVWRKISRYREPFEDWAGWRVGDAVWETAWYHRPLSWYVQTIRSAGLVITAFEEPAPKEEFLANESPQGPWIAEIPLHCVIEATKLNT